MKSFARNTCLPTVETNLEFLKADPLYETEKPYYVSVPLPTSQESLRTNLVYESRPVLIHNVRSISHLLSLETNGVEYIHMPVDFASNRDTEQSVDDYMVLHAGFLREKLGAELSVCYSSRYRVSAGSGSSSAPQNWQEQATEPAYTPHIDHTSSGGFRRIRAILSDEEVNKYMNSGKYRLRIINVWRPLYNPVHDTPLAVCDPATVATDDMMAADRVNPGYIGEIYYLKHSVEHWWYWISCQAPEEVLFFTSFDSDLDFGKSFIPHSAFKNPEAPSGSPPRESFELRVIVITRKADV